MAAAGGPKFEDWGLSSTSILKYLLNFQTTGCARTGVVYTCLWSYD